MPFSPVLFPRGRRVHRSSLQRSPLCRVGLGILQARRGGGVGGCHHNLSVLDRGKLPSPRGPFRHHRAELEGRDAPMSGESPAPIQNQPVAVRSSYKLAAIRGPCKPRASPSKALPVRPQVSALPESPPVSPPVWEPKESALPERPPKCLGFPSVPRTVIYPIFFFWGGGGMGGSNRHVPLSTLTQHWCLSSLHCHGHLRTLLHHESQNGRCPGGLLPCIHVPWSPPPRWMLYGVGRAYWDEAGLVSDLFPHV